MRSAMIKDILDVWVRYIKLNGKKKKKRQDKNFRSLFHPKNFANLIKKQVLKYFCNIKFIRK